MVEGSLQYYEALVEAMRVIYIVKGSVNTISSKNISLFLVEKNDEE